jgi:hypothetical protein
MYSCFLSPFLIEYKFTETLGTDFPDELMMVAVQREYLFMLWVYQPAVVQKYGCSMASFCCCLVQLGWALICTLYSFNPLLSAKYLLAKIWYIIPFVLFPLWVLKNKQIRIAGLCLLIPLLVLAALTLFRPVDGWLSFRKSKSGIVHLIFAQPC